MVEGVHIHTTVMQITTHGTSCLPVKSTTLSALSMTHTHTHGDLHEERGGESIWQVREAPLCSGLLLLCMCVCICICICVCVSVGKDDRGLHSLCRMRCLQNTFLTHTHTHINTSARTSPLLAPWVCGEDSSTVISYSFVLSVVTKLPH